MFEPNIRVNGNNNRTAGRDYHEYNAMEPINICPSCEVRFLTKGRNLCRRCEKILIRKQEHEEKIQQIRQRLLPILKFLVTCFLLGGGVIVLGPGDWQRPATLGVIMVVLLFIFALVGAGNEIEKLESKFKNTEDDSA